MTAFAPLSHANTSHTAARFVLSRESVADVAAREALLDLAMGVKRRRKSSEAIRRGRMPADGLSLVARDSDGRLIGTVRLWHVAAGESSTPALLLGPLAVSPDMAGAGIGSALMRRAVEDAAALGHAAILLVGDPAYYARFGFSAARTSGLSMPGPFERHRLLATELRDDALLGAAGLIRPSGRKLRQTAPFRPRAAAAAG